MLFFVGFLKKKNKDDINPMGSYFFDSIDRISNSRYIPDKDDIQLSKKFKKKSKSCIQTIKVNTHRMKLQMIGVTENAYNFYHFHMFDNIFAVIIIVDLTSYDKFLYEDFEMNAMYESLNLFENICCMRYTHIFL